MYVFLLSLCDNQNYYTITIIISSSRSCKNRFLWRFDTFSYYVSPSTMKLKSSLFQWNLMSNKNKLNISSVFLRTENMAKMLLTICFVCSDCAMASFAINCKSIFCCRQILVCSTENHSQVEFLFFIII